MVDDLQPLFQHFNFFESRLRLIKNRPAMLVDHVLGQVPDLAMFWHGHLSLGWILFACQDLEHSGLARAVASRQTDTVFWIDEEGNVVKEVVSSKTNSDGVYRDHASKN